MDRASWEQPGADDVLGLGVPMYVGGVASMALGLRAVGRGGDDSPVHVPIGAMQARDIAGASCGGGAPVNDPPCPEAPHPRAAPARPRRAAGGGQCRPAAGGRTPAARAAITSHGITTLMVRNIPGSVTQKRVLEELRRGGFDGAFDFVYVPSSFDSRENKGYGFVNFARPESVRAFVGAWHNSRVFCSNDADPALNVSAATVQGLEANIKKWSSRVRRIRNPELKPHVVPQVQPALAPHRPMLDLAVAPEVLDLVGRASALPALHADFGHMQSMDLAGESLLGMPFSFDTPPGLSLPLHGIYGNA